jgi:ribonuclease Y
VIASELGANVDVAKAAALLHDLGKAMDHEVEGTHASLGAEFARRHGVAPVIVNAIASHHHEVDQESVEAVIVEAADAISGARPGARRESLEQYIKRVKALESLPPPSRESPRALRFRAGRDPRARPTRRYRRSG